MGFRRSGDSESSCCAQARTLPAPHATHQGPPHDRCAGKRTLRMASRYSRLRDTAYCRPHSRERRAAVTIARRSCMGGTRRTYECVLFELALRADQQLHNARQCNRRTRTDRRLNRPCAAALAILLRVRACRHALANRPAPASMRSQPAQFGTACAGQPRRGASVDPAAPRTMVQASCSPRAADSATGASGSPLGTLRVRSIVTAAAAVRANGRA